MLAPQLPADEPQRLATLEAYNILDTPPDRSFDRLVQLAAEHFDVPISVVSLLDADRQWFKAAVGISGTETPRGEAFCAHAIAQPEEVFVVENATRDSRFADNPLVIGDPSIRFYAGALIRAENGQPLGTLCIIDKKPRQLAESGRKFLANLAGSAASMLELHRRNLILLDISERDPLTGLANRRVYDNALATACAATARGKTFALLAIDLDNFKSINDVFGHEVGDSVLKEVAARLNRVVRSKDLSARLGGDEFAVIVAGPIDRAGTEAVARRIMDALSADLILADQTVLVAASIGVALAPVHGTDTRGISKAADAALYSAKRGGRRAVVFAAAAESDEPDEHSRLDAALREAIANGKLSLHWQPYYQVRASDPCGFEALLRWTPPNRDPVPPMEIVAMAETGGYIAELDAMVLRQACTAAASWPLPLRVSVNMSASWFNSGDLVGLVSATLGASGLAPERLTIELTEQTLVRHTERSRRLIAALHAKGVAIALDDFGTGYASLGYLSSFEFDTVKLDRSFIACVGSSRRAEAVIHAILALARALDMAVCAEGIETTDQLLFLQQAGCDMAQGFLFGRPEAQITWPIANLDDALVTDHAVQRSAAE